MKTVFKLLAAIVIGLVCFWFTGGNQVLLNPAEVRYAVFTHADDKQSLFNWLLLFFAYGFAAGLAGIVISAFALFRLPRLLKKSPDQ